MAGARQWRLPCEHLDEDRAAERCMFSEVSSSNLKYFIKENRVADDISKSDLRDLYRRADQRDGNLVVCNSCDRIKIVVDADIETVHNGRAAV
jgi:hypothetical protein